LIDLATGSSYPVVAVALWMNARMGTVDADIGKWMEKEFG
jgi:hypothetical protein